MSPFPRRLAALLLTTLLAPALAAAQDAASPQPETGGDADSAVAAPEATRDPELYRAEVELLSQGAAERRAAAARALAQVMVKITGDPQAAAHPVVRRALPQAESFVVTSDTSEASDAGGNTAIGGVPILKTNMSFAFDPGSVDALVAGAGLGYWTSPRPRPLLWLAIDDGRGARLVNAQQLNVVKPLASRGVERGLRFGMPSGSSVEQAAVNTIWSLDPGPMQALTSRYGGETQLIGKLYRAGAGWTADWVLSDGGTVLSRWSFSDPSPQRALASGADGAADALARRDAVTVAAGEPGPLVIEVVRVHGAADFARAMGYLQKLAVVRELRVLEAGPDSLRLHLELAVGPEGFDRFLASGDVLQADPLAPPEARRYQLRP
ncbi:DUF2066 domain-containing protein [Arenimonas composti]|uniref:DUF2066 domain-containing protein n=1 Tax=Arenimonas composti TR7-09 = DSM 18010 TaxID=1121013 RepID=A0A091C4B6_9GAMM|nr:DUF2066 domain-containing protein [Arenimonas composti]KFN51455.1 hypothetical protein P873_02665 [Arenimonas composti TR7-09 = DSM 18010]